MIDLVYPEDRALTLQVTSEIMAGKLLTHFENRYMHKDGHIVHIMWSARWSESRRVRLAVARDITQAKRAALKQSAIYQISEAAHTTAGLPALYEQIHRIVAGLLHVESFLVAQYDDSGEALMVPYRSEASARAPGPFSREADSLITDVLKTGQPVLTSMAPGEQTGGRIAPNWLGVPLITTTGVIGALVVRSQSGMAHYTEDDKELLQYVSIQVATAIERKQAELRLRHLALHDELTDLPKRTLFNDRFEIALTRAHRNREQLALLYLDIDNFKYVNDTFGHDIGDRLLREVARRLAACVRESDTIGRIGGDEFTVLLTDIHDAPGVQTVVDKLHASLSAPLELNGQTLQISASVGIAIYPEHGDNLEVLLRHADAGMYTEKASGS
jgi:diguanylate cyclase (GGDEF)-like protein